MRNRPRTTDRLFVPRSFTPAQRMAARTAVDPKSGCHLWQGATTRRGYGQVNLFPKRKAAAHRVAYELANGPIPTGLVIDHLCRTPRCVNPAHLEAVTTRENVVRGVSMVAENARRTHCVHGHPFSTENTRWTKRGRRECKTCRREILKRWRARQRAMPTDTDEDA